LPTLPRATDIKTQRSAAAKAITVHEGRLRQLCLLKKQLCIELLSNLPCCVSYGMRPKRRARAALASKLLIPQ
jgi:hypothetical protein